ncbi:MAG TPA: chemotaxis protein CheA [Nitrospirota bacterium]|nr:chemotaxis protein CheA [Nitrospirota bacterium]
MSEYTFTDRELNDLKEIFFTEAYEILQSLNQEILNLESGHDREASMKTIQRYLHTLKGNSRALGFTSLNTLAHKSEDLLKSIQDTTIDIDRSLIDLLFSISDTLQFTVDSCRSNKNAPPDERLMERIESYLSAWGSGGSAGKDAKSKSENRPGALVYDIVIGFDGACDNKAFGLQVIKERLSTMGEVLRVESNGDSERVDSANQIFISFGSSEPAELIRDLIAVTGVVKEISINKHETGSTTETQAPGRDTTVKQEALPTLRVDALRVDKILNLVGEMVIGRSMIGQILSEIGERYQKDDLVKKLSDANAFMEKTLSQLQKNVMKIRMLPISHVFRKFPRVVRDLSVEKGKQVELVMLGEKTELDKGIIDVIGEPLIHLVRNAVDHGIEPPDERERAGKPRTGTVSLHAYHEGNQIMIDVKDDGAGLEPQRLKKKAIERGIKSREEIDRLSDEEAFDLIFLSGFSTADVVTDISGRGFGMDIVRTTVESLKGRIQVRSKPGEGTTFTLRLPLTLAIMRAMLFWVGKRLLAIPMSLIERITRVKDSDIQTVAGKYVLRFRDKVISLIFLNESLTADECSAGQDQKKFVIVVGSSDKLYGFVVDRLVGQQELVIKALDDYWGTINCASGASILGSGQVVLILDAPALIMRETRQEFIGT